MSSSKNSPTHAGRSRLLVQAALRYASLGIPVLPIFGVTYKQTGTGGSSHRVAICTCGKVNCDSPGKHPMTRNGYKDGTTDKEQLRRIFESHLEANIAIQTGKVSGIWVADVDKRHGGFDTWKKFGLSEADLKGVPISFTGGGGLHALFAYPAKDIPNVKKIGPGVDVKSDGGYIVVPPSNHVDGHYDWDSKNPLVAPKSLPAIPQKLLSLIPERRSTTPATQHSELWKLERIEEGDRNISLFSMGKELYRSGASTGMVLNSLYLNNAARCKPPLETDEVLRIIRSSKNYSGKATFNGPSIPLPTMPSVPSMDSLVLPYVISRFAADVAFRMNIPIEYVVIPLLCSLGAALGPKVVMRPKQNDPWGVHTNFWGMNVAPPGTKKSPAANEILREVYGLEKVADSWVENDQSIADAWPHHEPNSDPGTPLVLQPQLRYLVNDATPEKLLELMSENPNGFLLSVDELFSLFESFDKKSMNGLRHMLKTAWSADMAQTQDRIQRGTIRADRTCISIFGTIQPALLDKLSKAGILDNLMADGFLQRFCFATWSDQPLDFEFVDQPPDHQARKGFRDLLHQFAFSPGGHMSSIDPLGKHPLEFRFDKEAMTTYKSWMFHNAKVKAEHNNPGLVQYRNKLEGFVPALSLLFELCERFPDKTGDGNLVGRGALKMAIDMAEYCSAHTERIYSRSLDSSMVKAHALLAQIKDGTITSPFTIREVYRAGRSGLSTKQDVMAAARQLIEYNWVLEESNRSIETHGAKFIINPNQPD